MAADELCHRRLRLEAALGLLNDLPSDAILLREAGGEVVQFGLDAAIHPGYEPGQFRQGRFADGVDGGGEW